MGVLDGHEVRIQGDDDVECKQDAQEENSRHNHFLDKRGVFRGKCTSQ